MVKAIEAAYKAAQKAMESAYYAGVCTIIERRDVRDEKSKITRKSEVVVIENQPCKISYEKTNAAVSGDAATAVSLSTKLFISPEIAINSGSKVIVEQNGVTTEYCMSGEPAVYPTHKEIMLELFKGWA